MDPLFTQRLHISGLTSNLSSADLSQIISKFGTVRAVDGVGQLNGVDLPRNFAYVTVSITESNLRKCMSALSGSTFKGAKLRIAKAKPDFVERVAKEDASVHHRNESARVTEMNSCPAVTMSHLTEESIRKHRNGWRITPTGRIIYPAKMRPEKPLVMKDWANGAKGRPTKIRRSRKTRKSITTTGFRARRMVIDMVKWGSVHLKGVYMDVGGEPEAVPTSPRDGGGTGDGDAAMTEANGKTQSNELDISSPIQTGNLKDLFGSHGAEFSMLNHLDLDVEQEDDTDVPPLPIANTNETTTAPPKSQKHTPAFAPEPSQPLFFPSYHALSRLRDPLKVAKNSGWLWNDPSVKFYRVQGEEEIQEQWEQMKLSLTRDWKKRWREATKARKWRGEE